MTMIGTTMKANVPTVGLSIEAIYQCEMSCKENWLQQVFKVVGDKHYNNQSCLLWDLRSSYDMTNSGKTI